MNKNYLAPHIEVIEVDVEDAILATSGLEGLSDGATIGYSDEFFN